MEIVPRGRFPISCNTFTLTFNVKIYFTVKVTDYSVEKTVMEKGPVSTPETAGQVCTYVGISIDYIIAGVAKQFSKTVLSL